MCVLLCLWLSVCACVCVFCVRVRLLSVVRRRRVWLVCGLCLRARRFLDSIRRARFSIVGGALRCMASVEIKTTTETTMTQDV